MKAFIFFVFTALALSSCITCTEVNENCIEDIDPDCACYLVYDPVCGCNDVTYGKEGILGPFCARSGVQSLGLTADTSNVIV